MGTAGREQIPGDSLSGPFIFEHPAGMPRRYFREETMETDKTKQEIQNEIEQARRVFYASGRRVRYLSPGDEARSQNAKPRKQRLKMFA